MKSFFRVSAVVIFVLQLAVVVETQRPPHCPSCNIRRCENETVLQESCPEAQLVWDTCVCCKICGSRFGEPCGGAYGYLGTCEYGLDCTVEPSIYLSGTNISGECTRKVCIKNCTKRPERLKCGDDGRWYRNICALRQSKFCKGTGVSEAESRRVCDRACQLLRAPERGNITFSKGIAQTSVANISCQAPYILDGDQLRTCVEGPVGAAWNGTQPICRHPCELHTCASYEVCALDEDSSPSCGCGECPQVIDFVCANDGQTYQSRCHVRLTACRNSTPNLQTVSNGKCNSTKTDEFPGKRKR